MLPPSAYDSDEELAKKNIVIASGSIRVLDPRRVFEINEPLIKTLMEAWRRQKEKDRAELGRVL